MGYDYDGALVYHLSAKEYAKFFLTSTTVQTEKILTCGCSRRDSHRQKAGPFCPQCGKEWKEETISHDVPCYFGRKTDVRTSSLTMEPVMAEIRAFGLSVLEKGDEDEDSEIYISFSREGTSHGRCTDAIVNIGQMQKDLAVLKELGFDIDNLEVKVFVSY